MKYVPSAFNEIPLLAEYSVSNPNILLLIVVVVVVSLLVSLPLLLLLYIDG